MFGRNKVAMVVAEFLGTFSLVSVMLAMVGRSTFPFFSAMAAGAVYGLIVLLFGFALYGHSNPALTVAMWTVRKTETTRAIVFIAAQMLGGLAAWKLNEYLLEAPLKSIAGDKFVWRVLIAEALGAFIFAFGVAAALYQNYKGLRRAVTMGAALGAGIMMATFASNGLLNPAVALGLRSWSFAYVLGPILGAIAGMNLYAWVFAPEAALTKTVAKVAVGHTTFRLTRKTTKKSAKPARKRK